MQQAGQPRDHHARHSLSKGLNGGRKVLWTARVVGILGGRTVWECARAGLPLPDTPRLHIPGAQLGAPSSPEAQPAAAAAQAAGAPQDAAWSIMTARGQEGSPSFFHVVLNGKPRSDSKRERETPSVALPASVLEQGDGFRRQGLAWSS